MPLSDIRDWTGARFVAFGGASEQFADNPTVSPREHIVNECDKRKVIPKCSHCHISRSFYASPSLIQNVQHERVFERLQVASRIHDVNSKIQGL